MVPLGRISMGWHLCLPIQLESPSTCYELQEPQMVALIALGLLWVERPELLTHHNVQIGE